MYRHACYIYHLSKCISTEITAGTVAGTISACAGTAPASPGYSAIHVPIPNSMVNPAAVTLAAGSLTKTYGTILTGGPGSTNYTIISGSLQNGNTITSITIAYGSGAEAGAAVATYPGSVMPSDAIGGNGFLSNNYSFTYLDADITVNKPPLKIAADNKTKIFGSVNPILTVTYKGFVNNETEAQLTVKPVITTTATTASAVGQYAITVSGAVSLNYDFDYIDGILTVTPVIQFIVINNTFTPNGDGINDKWVIKNLNLYPNNTVNVYNRYGEKVYSSVGYANAWDGTYNGAQLPAGTYYYIVDTKNGSKALSGWVAIIR